MTALVETEREVGRRIRSILADRRAMAIPVTDGLHATATIRLGSKRALDALLQFAPQSQLELVLEELRFSPSLARSLMAAGYAQADALSVMFELTADQRLRAADLGALFNFGICVFDTMCDRFPKHRAALRATLGNATLESILRGSRIDVATPSRPVAFLLALIARYFESAREMTASRAVWEELVRTIQRMFTAEWSVTDVTRAKSAPTKDVFRRLRSKSVDPMWTLALGGLLQRPDLQDLRALRSTVRPAGEVLWLIDDLADLREDWAAGGWSRPWWIWVRSGTGSTDADESTALRGVLESGVVDAEAGRIADRIDRLRWSLPASGRRFFARVALSLRSWVDRLPS